ncbi:MAG: hypothetical protein ACRDJW_20855 [Thermomicrobiales bacterium]
MPTCSDGVVNGDESDVDCGGADCPPCADELQCFDDSDCESGFCNPFNVCRQQTCTDDIHNGAETDVDCGGPDCPPCANGLNCFIDADCQSDFCDLTDNTCRSAANCFDGIHNGDEPDVDCGGPTRCPRCANGRACFVDADCESNFCNFSAGAVCDDPSCSDEIQNGLETDMDCGGPECPPCDNRLGCRDDDDRVSGFCFTELPDFCREPYAGGTDPCGFDQCCTGSEVCCRGFDCCEADEFCCVPSTGGLPFCVGSPEMCGGIISPPNR